MNPTVIEIPTERGAMPVHFHSPDGDGPFPLVVLYMDAPGVRPALQGYAERLVSDGYRVAVPDLYYALDPADVPNLDAIAAGEPAEFARMLEAVALLDEKSVLEDTGAMVNALPGGAHAPWGCVGFCIGGRFALRAAETFGQDVGAAALLHPSKLVTDEPDSPHLTAGGVEARLYLGFGENDHVTPLSVIPPLRAELEQHGIDHRIEIIPGVGHGYMMPGMPGYNEAGAAQGWAGALAALGEGLGTVGAGDTSPAL